MKRYLILSLLATVIGYIKIHEKDNYQYTFKTSANLYIEVYRSKLREGFSSEYLTDSTNFRIYLGAFDEGNEQITTKCKGDDITVEKSVSTSSMSERNWPKVVDRKTYSLKNLKKQHLFE